MNLNDVNFLEKLARFVPYILTLLGFVIAIFNQRIVDLRKDEKIEEKSARFARYFFISLGLVIAMSGQFVKTKIDSRIVDLRKDEKIEEKNTRPLMDVSLEKSVQTGKILLLINASNETPFKANWDIVTENNRIVSGILLEKPEIFPNEKKKEFLYEVTINDGKVVNNYIELRFNFESIFSSELSNPEHLRGNIIKKYKYVRGNIFPLEEAVNNQSQ